MRFASIIIAGTLAVLAHAQSSTTKPAASTTSVNTAQTSEQARMEACLAACKPDDVKCRADCITVPSPSHSQVNQTTECVAKCPQGSGSPADTEAYRVCVDGCIAKYYYTTGGTIAGTTATGSASGTGAGGASATGTGSASGSDATGSASGSASATGKSAASTFRVGSYAIGLVAFAAAFFSL